MAQPDSLASGLQLAIEHAGTLDSVFRQLGQWDDEEKWAEIKARWPAARREDFFRDAEPT